MLKKVMGLLIVASLVFTACGFKRVQAGESYALIANSPIAATYELEKEVLDVTSAHNGDEYKRMKERGDFVTADIGTTVTVISEQDGICEVKVDYTGDKAYCLTEDIIVPKL